MPNTPFFSIIIPVYNRPDEVRELLHSLSHQEEKDFEVIIVEDGSTQTCKEEVHAFRAQLDIRYYFKENSGQGFSRNFGFEKARGEWFVIFDSDCLIPPQYFQIVRQAITQDQLDAYGGPDAAHESFTPTQKAISYAMTSLFTTGGIRGRKKHAGTFHPRSFNMGLSREVYDKVGGFIITRKGEDIEFSLRMIKAGFKLGLIDQAAVYHKRRTSFGQFWKQLQFFGSARVNINRYHPGEIKLVHLFPVFFFLGWIALVLALPFVAVARALLLLYLFYFSVILMDASFRNRDLRIGLMSIWAAFIQLSAYGYGFLREWIGFKA